jgi:hypothetical protein
VARFYPQALGSLFIPSYDSQGYGGGIRTRLHTNPRYIIPARTEEKTSLPLLRVLSLPGKQRVHGDVP